MAVVDEARELLQAQLDALNAEEQQLRRAIDALSGTNGRKRPGRPPKAVSEPQTGRKRGAGKRARKGERKGQFLDAVSAAGPEGITVAAVAKQVGVKPAQLHALARKLEQEGEVSKDGPRYKPASSDAPEPAKPKAQKPKRSTKPKAPKASKETKEQGESKEVKEEQVAA